jgi:hypothetical protein
MEVAIKQLHLSDVELGTIIEHNFEKYLENVDSILQYLKCARCGRCCRICAAMLSVEDLSRLSAKFGVNMLGEKTITASDLTSDSWEELDEKLKHVTWEGIPIIRATRAPSGKIIVTEIQIIAIGK